MFRLSRYNHFQPLQDGNYIAYNAFSGALALMAGENYAIFNNLVEKLVAEPPPELNDAEKELMKHLEFGGYICREGDDQRAMLKFKHNYHRYDATNLGLVIAPTMACNMACPYCYEGSRSGRMSPETAATVVSFARARAPRLKTLTLGWFGGEPLLAMDLIESLSQSFMAIAKEHDLGYSAMMITNGTLLTPNVADRLEKLEVTNIQVTIDGPSRMHNVKRPLKNGKESFPTIIENIAYAADKTKLGLRINIDKSFTPEVIKELLDELNAGGLRKKVSINFGHLEPYTDVCANISESCHGTADFSKAEAGFYRVLLENGFRIDKAPRPITTFCMVQTTNSFLLDPAGEIYRCFHHVSDTQKSIGNIRDEINYGHQNFLRMFSFDPFADEECSRCSLLPICMGGCPARRLDRKLPEEQVCQSWRYNLEPMLEVVALYKQQEYQAQQKVRQTAEEIQVGE